ncbi:DUF4244 domain-containing protein [Saccharopolyspora indica]|uniref:DUF4244 domain-containing protein n=1 Tax=Saccharopolyspora indica TaxID=1229659 RepID=UPI0022EB1C51|nr:DUF4244 domain-containing protein [Saccharopolyspora indica]MDA3648668.1 DUF4244 domain-containing protein [Saccharopolyspora indica]
MTRTIMTTRWAAARRLRALLHGDGGMTTAEYAMGTVAAVAFASLLFEIVTGGTIKEALTGLIERGLEGGGI